MFCTPCFHKYCTKKRSKNSAKKGKRGVDDKLLYVEEMEAIRKVWERFDLNGDGIVSVDQVHKFLLGLKIKIPQEEMARIEKELDRNENGTIEFVEFAKNYQKGLFKNYIC